MDSHQSCCFYCRLLVVVVVVVVVVAVVAVVVVVVFKTGVPVAHIFKGLIFYQKLYLKNEKYL
jgi:hypothetical protein